jgi:hypothetical protein
VADEQTTSTEAEEEQTTEETEEQETSTEETEEEFDRDRAMATIRAQRESEDQAKEQAREERERREQVEAELRELKRSGLSEGEQIQADLDEAKSQLETVTGERDEARRELSELKQELVVQDVARRFKAYDPSEIAVLLTDGEKSDKAAAEKAVKRLKKEKPRFFEPESPSGGQITPGSGSTGSDMNDFIRSGGRGR